MNMIQQNAHRILPSPRARFCRVAQHWLTELSPAELSVAVTLALAFRPTLATDLPSGAQRHLRKLDALGIVTRRRDHGHAPYTYQVCEPCAQYAHVPVELADLTPGTLRAVAACVLTAKGKRDLWTQQGLLFPQVAQAAQLLGVSRSRIYRALREAVGTGHLVRRGQAYVLASLAHLDSEPVAQEALREGTSGLPIGPARCEPDVHPQSRICEPDVHPQARAHIEERARVPADKSTSLPYTSSTIGPPARSEAASPRAEGQVRRALPTKSALPSHVTEALHSAGLTPTTVAELAQLEPEVLDAVGPRLLGAVTAGRVRSQAAYLRSLVTSYRRGSEHWTAPDDLQRRSWRRATAPPKPAPPGCYCARCSARWAYRSPRDAAGCPECRSPYVGRDTDTSADREALLAEADREARSVLHRCARGCLFVIVPVLPEEGPGPCPRCGGPLVVAGEEERSKAGGPSELQGHD